jgi:hypothetical protein
MITNARQQTKYRQGTFGEVTKSKPPSTAAELGAVLASLVDLLGADGAASAGLYSTIAWPNTGGPGATGFGAGAALPISLLTRMLKVPTCHPSILLITLDGCCGAVFENNYHKKNSKNTLKRPPL